MSGARRARLRSAPVLVLLALLAAACDDGPAAPSAVSSIRSQVSFGFCVGFCTRRLEVGPTEAVLVYEDRRNQATRRFSAPLNVAEWNALADAARQVESGLANLPSVVGCPDCADGGAEDLAVVYAERGERRVTFEYGAALRPAEPLLQRVRALRERLERQFPPGPPR